MTNLIKPLQWKNNFRYVKTVFGIYQILSADEGKWIVVLESGDSRITRGDFLTAFDAKERAEEDYKARVQALLDLDDPQPYRFLTDKDEDENQKQLPFHE